MLIAITDAALQSDPVYWRDVIKLAKQRHQFICVRECEATDDIIDGWDKWQAVNGFLLPTFYGNDTRWNKPDLWIGEKHGQPTS